MKKLMLVCCFVIGATAMSFAQGGGRGPQKPPAEQAKDLQASLKLTDDQTAKVTAIYTANAAKRDSLTKAGADRAAMRPLRQEATDKINAILTADQKAAWKKQMDEMRAKMGGGQGGGGGTPPPPPAK
ncbi:MAG: Spy/CpxP family protein refolding chaperone [Bacteroidota bacterium]